MSEDESDDRDGTGDAAGGTTFDRELANARALLEADDVTAIHVGVVRGGEVDTTFAQTADTPEEEGLRALTLLATHLRAVAEEAGVDYETLAADAAGLAGSVEELPEVDPDSGTDSPR
ncbi:hypothetical protein [Halorarum halobium]|uniref:hypothetical protein n=1 Tax=Halorarum halobium TaxID=3075121 RepID=UPI0028A5E580|nr:hypothetical protein [Halobaculum sp. XH14]